MTAEKGYNATVISNTLVTPELMLIRILPDAGVPEFVPGQYVALGLREGEGVGKGGALSRSTGPLPSPGKIIKRAYSIGSSPEEKDFLEFCITRVSNGELSPQISDLQAGDRLFAAPKVTGHFTLAVVPNDKNLLFLSTGTGIAPFVSMLRTKTTWTGRKITAVHCVRFEHDLTYHQELLQCEKEHPETFSYIATVTRAKNDWTGLRGRIPVLLGSDIPMPDPNTTHVFLCGNPGMIEEVTGILAHHGFSEYTKRNPLGTLHLEKYW